VPSSLASEILAETDARYDRRWQWVERTDALGAVVAALILLTAASQIAFAASRQEPTVSKAVECRQKAATKLVVFDCNGGRMKEKK
jgi:hypothetical protein